MYPSFDILLEGFANALGPQLGRFTINSDNRVGSSLFYPAVTVSLK